MELLALTDFFAVVKFLENLSLLLFKLSLDHLFEDLSWHALLTFFEFVRILSKLLWVTFSFVLVVFVIRVRTHTFILCVFFFSGVDHLIELSLDGFAVDLILTFLILFLVNWIILLFNLHWLSLDIVRSFCLRGIENGSIHFGGLPFSDLALVKI